jgi:hypothetical protein
MMIVMLELRPICESCATDLPPGSTNAMICSYECTFCATCVDEVLQNVCPNCGGGFVPRPIRPSRDWRPGASLSDNPPTTERRHRPVTPETQERLVALVGGVPPEDR